MSVTTRPRQHGLPSGAPTPPPEAVTAATRAWKPGAAILRYRRIAIWIAIPRTICVCISLVVAYLARYGLGGPPWASYALATAAAPAIWVATFYGFGLYRPHHLAGWQEFERILCASAVGVMLAATASFWTHSNLSRKWIAFTWVFVVVLELATRRAWRWYTWRERMANRLVMRTLVVGTGSKAVRLAHALNSADTGCLPIGFVPVGRSTPRRKPLPLPTVGSVANLEETIHELDVDCVFVPEAGPDATEIAAIRRAARRTECDLRVATTLPEMIVAPVAIQPLAGSMVLTLRGSHPVRGHYLAKRTFDATAATCLLVVLRRFYSPRRSRSSSRLLGPSSFDNLASLETGRSSRC